MSIKVKQDDEIITFLTKMEKIVSFFGETRGVISVYVKFFNFIYIFLKVDQKAANEKFNSILLVFLYIFLKITRVEQTLSPFSTNGVRT